MKEPRPVASLLSAEIEHGRLEHLFDSHYLLFCLLVFSATQVTFTGCVVPFGSGGQSTGDRDSAVKDAATKDASLLDGATPPACNAALCPEGCCSEEGACRSGASDSLCGNGGNPCLDCLAMSQICQDLQCVTPPDCDEGDTVTCGTCGTRTCDAQGSWGACESTGVCVPDSLENQGCGNCGTQSRTCNNQCQWSEWSTCTGEGVCAPSATQSQACGDCGTQSRTCTSSCAWGSWSSCSGEGVCAPS
ncbi:MAG: hypothetical protein RBU30_07295, partial [Polyangia bacterium]|nr:hypothetical protein [Polyangia bacterium]